MPTFGGVRSIHIRAHVVLDEADRALLARIEARAHNPLATALTAAERSETLRTLHRLRQAGKAKPLPSGKWTTQ